ncbi:hypothetical protein QJS10_CPB19g00502 [Acorus calamus]|uniref:KIB1-4 beta-propeller domain-containing protein n=1 Tax=Acorus calamus TaxID=4465 RepID=A0AAV9CE90_ACOCL|nr:hypothetical protein QJS10_CPB19g00502 [Acorus calamus]
MFEVFELDEGGMTWARTCSLRGGMLFLGMNTSMWLANSHGWQECKKDSKFFKDDNFGVFRLEDGVTESIFDDRGMMYPYMGRSHFASVDMLCKMMIAGTSLFGILLSKYAPVTCLKLAAGLMIWSLPVLLGLTHARSPVGIENIPHEYWKQCLKQKGNIECGYFVIKYRKDIIENPEIHILQKFEIGTTIE